MAWSGPIDLRFEHGLLEVCTYEKPACQSFTTWSVPAIVNCLIGRVFWICSGFVHMKTEHARVLAANVLFSSLFPLGLMLSYVAGSFSTDLDVWERMAGSMCLTGSLPLSNYCVCSLAAGFRFHLYSMCLPLPQNFNVGCCANGRPLR